MTPVMHHAVARTTRHERRDDRTEREDSVSTVPPEGMSNHEQLAQAATNDIIIWHRPGDDVVKVTKGSANPSSTHDDQNVIVFRVLPGANNFLRIEAHAP